VVCTGVLDRRVVADTRATAWGGTRVGCVQVCKACKVDMTDDELRKMADECDAGNGRASVNKLSLALRRWQLYRVNQEPYNNPRTRLYSPTPRVHHDMPSRTVVVPPKRQQPVWPTEDDQNSQVQISTSAERPGLSQTLRYCAG
jgi:hypothetical protein